MTDTCENRLGLVNSCVHYAHQTCRLYLTQWISKTVDSKYNVAWNTKKL